MNIAFGTYAVQKNDLLSNFLLASSIRDFAGSLSGAPIHIFLSSDLSMQGELKKFDGLNVTFSTFARSKKRHRYAFKPAAACACEAEVKSGTVIWLDRHMIVLNSCDELVLNSLENFAYRPPHLKILGMSVDKPIDDMWAMACKIAEVDESLLFHVCTEFDAQKIWSYFSAGHFSFRAEAGIMADWDALFNTLAENIEMKKFLADEAVRTYLHQIALTLSVLRTQNKKELKPLPHLYGYPTHLYKKIDEARTAFYTPHNKIPKKSISESLACWLNSRINLYQSNKSIIAIDK